MQYCLSRLTEEAAAMVKHLPVTADQFEQAWMILTVNYEKNHVKIKKYLDELFSMKPMQSQTAPEMRRIATTIKILNELEALGRPIKYWDDLIIYLTISRIDFQSQKIWQSILENSEKPNELPSTYADLKKFLNIRTNRS